MITKNRYRLLRMIMLFALLLTPFMVYAQDDHLPPSEALDVVNHLVGEWPEYSIWIIGAFITLIFIYVVTILFKRGNGIFEKKDTIAFSFISLLGLLKLGDIEFTFNDIAVAFDGFAPRIIINMDGA